nr:MAG TPA: hypothetical protein [Caudoviricetes sp.]
MEPVGVTEILLKQRIAEFITPFTALFQSKQKNRSISERFIGIINLFFLFDFFILL